jgi:hypothetical protein
LSARTALQAAGQLELFDASPPPLCLHYSAARGLPARIAEFAAWQAEHGSFGSMLRAHAWTPSMGGAPDSPADRCQAAVMSVDLRRHPRDGDRGLKCRCTAADAYLYRGACRCCDWEGVPRPGLEAENLAAEDALDHAWPGWRDLPAVVQKPDNPKSAPRWLERVTAAYPAGWLEAGGPIRTWRQPLGTRHVPGYGPFGGYDAGVLAEQESS